MVLTKKHHKAQGSSCTCLTSIRFFMHMPHKQTERKLHTNTHSILPLIATIQACKPMVSKTYAVVQHPDLSDVIFKPVYSNNINLYLIFRT